MERRIKDNELVLEIIRLGVQAGGCWRLSKDEVEAASGLEDLARYYGSMSSMLMDEAIEPAALERETAGSSRRTAAAQAWPGVGRSSQGLEL